MCGTFAILSPDLFTYVYSRIPPGKEREFIQKDEGRIRREVPAKGAREKMAVGDKSLLEGRGKFSEDGGWC